MRAVWIGLALACLLTPAAGAQTASAGTVTVANVILEGDQVFIQGSGIANPLNFSNGNMIVLRATSVMRDHFLAAAMTALTAGLKVHIWVTTYSGPSWATAGTASYMNVSR